MGESLRVAPVSAWGPRGFNEYLWQLHVALAGPIALLTVPSPHIGRVASTCLRSGRMELAVSAWGPGTLPGDSTSTYGSRMWRLLIGLPS